MSPATGGENSYVDEVADALRARGWVVDAFDRRQALTHPDVIHVHWPEYLVRWDASLVVALADVVKVLLVLCLARVRGSRLVWTAHNLQPHSLPRPRLSRLFFTLFTAQVDLVITLTDAGGSVVRGRYPRLRRTPFRRVPHGDYRRAHPAVARDQAREQLGWPSAPTYLLFGQVRRYKNVVGLVTAFGSHAGEDRRLVVAGQPREEGLEAEIRAAAGDDPRIRLELRQVAHDDVGLVLSASDVVVLPYRDGSALNSGVALLALSVGRPVVMTATATAAELSAAVGPEWVLVCDGTAEDALRVADRALTTPRGPAPDLGEFTWSRVGDLTVSAFQDSLVSRRHARTAG